MDVSEIPTTQATQSEQDVQKKVFTSEYKAAIVDQYAIEFGLNPKFLDALLSSMNCWSRQKFLKALAKKL